MTGSVPILFGGNALAVDGTALRGLVGYNIKRTLNVIRSDLTRTLKPFDLRMISFTALVLIENLQKPGATG